MSFYQTKDQRRKARDRLQNRKGVGAKGSDRSGFWAGMLMGAATATGGFFAIKALEKTFAKKEQGVPALQNPGNTPAAQRLLASAQGQPAPAALNSAAKAPVVKRTVIEEMVEDLDG